MPDEFDKHSGADKAFSLPLPSQTSTPAKRIGIQKLLALLLASSLLYSFQCLPSSWFSRSRHHPHHGKHPLFGKRAEEAFLTVPNSEEAVKASRLFATKPHMAGTPGDLDTAKDFLKLLQRELGITPPSSVPIFAAGSSDSQHATRSISKSHRASAWIDTYYPMMNTPLDRSLQVVDPNGTVIFNADLVEFSDSTDPEAAKYSDDVPTFHGLSRGGDVTAKLVDGNYCTQEDYGNLVAKNVDLDGTIVLCRYGGIFRGLKVKGGQELGASAVLIYSDPQDDGTVTVENGYLPYPHGPARNPTSVQRGSVQYLSIYPGDPTTPGYPSYENSTRTEGENIPLIPSLPISWSNAAAMFRTLTRDDAWEGKLVRLVNNVDTRVIPIWNTMGVIPGFIKNEVVVIGNHRDAWVMGAADPSSGTASMHEVVRGLGHLLRNGWKPLRTILIASWDAEEYGLIGSTEWGEDFKDWIDENVVTYLNLDSSVSGSRLGASGSPLLAHFIRDAAQRIPHPTDKGRTLWDARLDTGAFFGLLPNSTQTVKDEVIAIREMEVAMADEIGVSPLGSGSDYTVFLQRSGIPSTNGGFSATIHDPVYHYHSVFDSERWQELYADPGFHRHVAVAKHLGLQTLRLSSSPLLPFNTTHYAFQIEDYLERVESIATEALLEVNFNPLRESIKALQKYSIKLDKANAKAHRDLKRLVKKWKKKHSRRHRVKRFLKQSLCKIKKIFGRGCSCPHKPTTSENATEDGQDHDQILLGMMLHQGFQGRFDGVQVHSLPHHKLPLKRLREVVKRIQTVNKKASAFERGFISEDGIKDREWYKHLAVAPGKWLGYGATTLPGLTEALTFEKNATMAQSEADRLQDLIDKIVEKIKI